MRKNIFLIFIALSAILYGVYGRQEAPEGGRAAGAAPEGASKSPRSERAHRDLSLGANACRFERGDRLAFVGETRAHAVADLGAVLSAFQTHGAVDLTTSSRQETESVQRWRLEARVVGEREESAVLAATMTLEMNQLNGERQDAPYDLSQPFLIQISERCTVEAFGWRPDTNRSLLRDQQSLALSLSFASSSPGRYRAPGVDFTGHYLMDYEFDGRQIRGHRVAYTSLFEEHQALGEAAVETRVRRDEHVVDVKAEGGLERATSERSLSFEVRGISIGFLELSSSVERRSPRGDAPRDMEGAWVWGFALSEGARETEPLIADDVSRPRRGLSRGRAGAGDTAGGERRRTPQGLHAVYAATGSARIRSACPS